MEMSSLDIIRVPVDGPPKKTALQIKDPSKQSYWWVLANACKDNKDIDVLMMIPHRMPRKSFLKVLQAGVGAAEGITVLPNASCSEIRKTDEGGLQVSTDNEGLMPSSFGSLQILSTAVHLQVVADVDGTKTTFQPRLLVGCDGLGSGVRQTLHEWDPSGRYDRDIGGPWRAKTSMNLFRHYSTVSIITEAVLLLILQVCDE